jgi:hypothetical protein
MKTMKSIVVSLLILVLFLSSMVSGCVDESKDEIISPSDGLLRLEPAGTWNYSFFPGLEDIDFEYDPEGRLIDAITITETTINGKQYLLLSFDPMSGPGQNSRVFIFDTTDPLSPQLVSSIAHPDEERKSYLVRSVAVQDGILYAGLFGDKGLWMVNISDPANPKDLGISTVELHKDLIVSGNYAYASGQMFNGVSICDISDIENIKEVARQDISTRDCRMALSGNLLYVGIENILTVYDVSTPSSPRQVGTCELEVSGNLTIDLPFPEPGKVHWGNWAHINDIQASGDYVYVTFGAGQVRIIEVSDPVNPKEVAYVDLGGFAISLTLKDNLLYVTRSDADDPVLHLCILDVSEIDNPKVIDSIATGSMFGFGGATLGYMWARPQIIGDCIYVAGINYFDIFNLE